MSPASAAPNQGGGDDVPSWSNNWSWTYQQTFVYNDPSGPTAVTVNETVTDKVLGVTTYNGYSVYNVQMSGSATGGSASASGQSGSVTGGSVSGTEYLRVSDLALVYETQTHNINLTIDTFFSENVVATVNLTPAPPWRSTDFRLHNTDSWQTAESIAYSGSVVYSGVQSGNSPLGPGTFSLNGTSNDTSTNLSVPIGTLATDDVQVSDPSSGASAGIWWAPSADNVAQEILNLPINGATVTLTDKLASDSLPAPATTVSENLPAGTAGLVCAGGPITVSGALSPGTSGTPVTVTLDESPLGAGTVQTATTTTGSGGTYSVNSLTAPAAADGLQKGGVRGAWGVVVNAGGASAAQTLEVGSVDCSSTAYTGSTSAQTGSSAAVSAKVVDLATGAGVSGATVVFSLTGQAGTASGVTNGSGVATASLPITAAPGAYTLTASYGGSATETASSATSPFTVTIDGTSTALTASSPSVQQGHDVTFTATVTPSSPSTQTLDGNVAFTVDGNPIGSPVPLSGGVAQSAPLNTSGLTLGTHQIVATYSGNTFYSGSTGKIPAYDVHGPLTATSTTLSVTPSGSSVYGQPVQLTATVTPTVGNTASAVTFYDGTTPLGSADLSGGSPDTATLTTTSLSVGSHSLSATYNGDGDVTYAPSQSNPVALNVVQGSTTTSVSLVTPATTPYAFEPTTFGVTVSGPAGDAFTPTGTVQVTVNGVGLGGPITLSGGTATVNDPNGLPAGSNTITAVYSGDTNFTGSNGSLSQNVTKASTTTGLVSSTGNSGSVAGQTVTFTADVTPEGTGNPTGLVTFFDCTVAGPCSNQIGTSTLTATGSAGAAATLQLSTLPTGDNFITASYAGDSNFDGSASAPFDQVVTPPPPVAATSTTLTGTTSPPNASPNTSVYGQTVTFTATVSVAGSQHALTAPAGTVQFSVDGSNLGGPVAVTPGSGSPGTGWTSTASINTTSALAAGGHSVIATYSGLSGAGIPQAFSGSGAIITQEVQQAQTSVSGSPSANPAAFGQSVTFSATTAAVAPGAGVPGGSVQFSLDGTAFGTPVKFTGGSATSGAATGLQPGTHTVSFVTSGDANFLGSSGSFTFTVSTIPTTTTLTATPSTVSFGSPVTLTATVSHSTGSGTPTGTVTFKDGTAVLGVVGVAPSAGGSAQASLVISTLVVGSHSITAIYSGSPTFGGSTSNPVTVTVNKAATKVVPQAAILTYNLSNLLTPNGSLNLGPLYATLTTASGAPIAGQTLVFTAIASPGGPVVCTGVTNSQGLATCTPAGLGILEVILTGGFTATYAGNGSFQGSEASAGLIDLIL